MKERAQVNDSDELIDTDELKSSSADMEKVCLLPRPDLGIFNNIRKISDKKLTI